MCRKKLLAKKQQKKVQECGGRPGSSIEKMLSRDNYWHTIVAKEMENKIIHLIALC